MFFAGYSWLASQLDLTGMRGSVVFLGANIGWLVFPPLAGALIFSGPGGVGLYYITLTLTLAHISLFLIMIKVSSVRK